MTTPTRCLAVLVWALAVALVGGQRCPDLEINLNVNEAVPTEVVNSSGYSDITYFALERWESYQVTSYSVGLAYEDSEADVLPGGLITSSLTDDCAVTVLPWADFLGVTGNTQACESEEAAVTTVVPFSLVYTTNESTIPGYPDTAPGTGSARRQLKAAKTGTVSTYPDASLTAVSSSSSSQLHRRFLQDVDTEPIVAAPAQAQASACDGDFTQVLSRYDALQSEQYPGYYYFVARAGGETGSEGHTFFCLAGVGTCRTDCIDVDDFLVSASVSFQDVCRDAGIRGT